MYVKITNNNIIENTQNIRSKFPNVSFTNPLPTTIENWKKVQGQAESAIDQELDTTEIVLDSNGDPVYKFTYKDKTEDQVNSFKNEAYLIVDTRAEDERLLYITDGAGQANVYRQKFEEASAYLAETNPVLSEYPHIAAEVGITGDNPTTVAQIIYTTATEWNYMSAYIEGVRMSTKQLIATKTKISEIQTILDNLTYEVNFD